MILRDFYGYQGVNKLNDLLKLNLFEGFVVLNQQHDEILSKYLDEIGVPHVLLVYHNRLDKTQSNVIDTDNYLGAYMATKHLIDLGHKHILALTTPLSEFNDRMRGYKAALVENGIEYHPNLVISTGCDYNSAYKTTLDRLSDFGEATACFAQFDVGAMAMCNAFKELGKNIPNDFSIIGFDDLDISRIFNPPLTTIRQPYDLLAEKAVEVITSSLNYPNITHSKVFLPPELIIRATTAPPNYKGRKL